MKGCVYVGGRGREVSMGKACVCAKEGRDERVCVYMTHQH